jgi:hypothetical protein
MMGFGNLIPRTGKHLSIPFEFGAAFMGTPRVNVQLNEPPAPMRVVLTLRRIQRYSKTWQTKSPS